MQEIAKKFARILTKPPAMQCQFSAATEKKRLTERVYRQAVELLRETMERGRE